jgi:hypothetical protein
MWRHLLYLLCTVEAAALAAVLVTAVVEPGVTGVILSPGLRQVCAISALALMVGCAVAAWSWLRYGMALGRERINF